MPITFNEEEKKIKNIANRVKSAFNRMKHYDFEKSKPAKIIFDWSYKECNNNGTTLIQKSEKNNNGRIIEVEDILKEVDNIEINHNYWRNDVISLQKLQNNKNKGFYLDDSIFC